MSKGSQKEYGGSEITGKDPSDREWKELYDAAAEFKKLGCWKWMRDSDIFGVLNPATGETGYCSVMGMLGMHFALGVYRGREGLEGYLRVQSKVQSRGLPPTFEDMMLEQRCLMASFEDRESLRERDLRVIGRLGLEFRGHNSWPLFRSHRPSFYPWYVTREEAKFLTLSLRQVSEVACRFKKDPDLFEPPESGKYLVRVPEETGGELKWADKWLEPPPEKERDAPKPPDSDVLEEIKGSNPRRRGAWEVDFFLLPNPVKDSVEDMEERPYFPYILLCMDRDTRFILEVHPSKPTEYKSEFRERFLDLLRGTAPSLPREILVKKEEAIELLKPITSRLGIELRRVNRFRVLEEAKSELIEGGGNI